MRHERMSAEPTLNLIPIDAVEKVWPLAEPVLEQVVARSRGKTTMEAVRARCLSGETQLWMIWNGTPMAAGTSQIISDDDGALVLVLLGWAGEHSIAWLHLMAELEEWGRQQGCTRIRSVMRRGWARKLPDWTMTNVILEKDLARG